MTPDALPVTRRGVTRWEPPVVNNLVTLAAPALDALATFDADEHRARCARADLAAVMVEIGRIGRVVDRLAQVVDVRIELT